MKLFSFSAISLLLLGVFCFSCTHEPQNLDELNAVCFDTQILPLLKTSCGIAGCHDGSEEHFRVTGYNSVMELVSPGDPRQSELYTIITDINSHDMMPPHNPLTKTQRNLIQVWIAQGAKETICSQDTGGNVIDQVCFVQDILPMMLSSCAVTGCHDQTTAEEDYVFMSYAGVMEGISPFNPGNSEIYESVTDNGEDIMPPPPRAPLSADQIADLVEWIENGATNSDCPGNVCDSAGTISFSTQIDPFLKNTCTGCHNSTAANGNVNLSGYANVALQASNLRNGIPLMVGSMKKLSGFVAMPPSYTVDDCNIVVVEKWIGQGAENN